MASIAGKRARQPNNSSKILLVYCRMPASPAVLNRLGIRSAKGHTWTQLRVRNFRAEREIAIYREGERARDEVS